MAHQFLVAVQSKYALRMFAAITEYNAILLASLALHLTILCLRIKGGKQ